MTGPKLSIILPVYGVEDYLGECLESILNQSYQDFEIIAVNDASPDRSLGILRRYADKDNRIKILNLSKNVGLGLARNAGLSAASGEYIWFLDSDDSLYDNVIDGIIKKIENSGAELLICGWTQSFCDGRQVKPKTSKILEHSPVVFDVHSYPEIMRVFHVAWNKITSRSKLGESGLEFASGWYEDVDFSYPLLSSVNSITCYPEPCVKYRQQREGSILTTRSDRHFEAFTHWERSLAKLGGSENRDVRRQMLPILIDGLLAIAFHPGRLHPERRGEFLACSGDLVDRWSESLGQRDIFAAFTATWMKQRRSRSLYFFWRVIRVADRVEIEVRSMIRNFLGAVRSRSE